jgi:hypothetical protein
MLCVVNMVTLIVIGVDLGAHDKYIPIKINKHHVQ